jgi:hypothetical protein
MPAVAWEPSGALTAWRGISFIVPADFAAQDLAEGLVI